MLSANVLRLSSLRWCLVQDAYRSSICLGRRQDLFQDKEALLINDLSLIRQGSLGRGRGLGMESSKGAKALEESEAGSESYRSHTYVLEVAADLGPRARSATSTPKTSRTANGPVLIFIPGCQALVLHLA